jgi:hypothetical protein
MASDKQPARCEATILAAVMAIAGAPILFDRLETLVRTCVLCVPAAIHMAPVMLVAVGAILLLTEESASTVESDRQNGKDGGQQ